MCENAKSGGMDKQNCPLRSYKLDVNQSEYFDLQSMKLQEAPEQIPTGEMPRSIEVTVDRYLTDTCTPGNRVKIMGIFCISRMSSSKNDASSNKRFQSSI